MILINSRLLYIRGTSFARKLRASYIILAPTSKKLCSDTWNRPLIYMPAKPLLFPVSRIGTG
ncbi:MAG: hypothetical protein CEE38_22140 [Planctomycetes bacterium B3_Pla]|nr:MAG: hypothetical protein CEE38_22140 [Planctomycetes bacterium B3_Pla]